MKVGCHCHRPPLLDTNLIHLDSLRVKVRLESKACRENPVNWKDLARVFDCIKVVWTLRFHCTRSYGSFALICLIELIWERNNMLVHIGSKKPSGKGKLASSSYFCHWKIKYPWLSIQRVLNSWWILNWDSINFYLFDTRLYLYSVTKGFKIGWT